MRLHLRLVLLPPKNEIAEEDLSEALKAVIDGKMDSSDSMTAQEIQQAIATAIS